MTRWIPGVVALAASLCFAGASAQAQVFYAYGSPVPVYAPAVVYPSPVMTYAYPAPVAYTAAYAPQPIVQMAYSVPAVVATPAYVAPAVVVNPGFARTTVRNGPFNYVETTRAYGPTPGPHFSRLHVHYGPLGTTVRERIR
jgi:hypothetical protein